MPPRRAAGHQQQKQQEPPKPKGPPMAPGLICDSLRQVNGIRPRQPQRREGAVEHTYIYFALACDTGNTMAASWPQWLLNSFVSASQPQFAVNESVYYGPYIRLLYHLFGVEGPFEISPQFHIPRGQTRRDSVNIVALFVVELNKRPVLFIEVQPPGTFAFDSKRKQADDQMRDRFRDFRYSLITPRLPGISAFGTPFTNTWPLPTISPRMRLPPI